MSQIWFYSLTSVVIVSLISFVGLLTLSVGQERLKKTLIYLVSFAAGALLGDVFLHILPEISKDGFSSVTGLYILVGIVIFFVLEKLIWWHHSHSEHKEAIHSTVYLSQAADSLHNFIDGIIIAVAFLISPKVGLATTLAVIFHEIPQEIGNFAVFIHGGWTVKKALFYNFLSALTAIVGALLVLIFFKNIPEVPVWLIALAASSFIYIAMTDLIPEIHKETNAKKSGWLLLSMCLGIFSMALILLLE